MQLDSESSLPVESMKNWWRSPWSPRLRKKESRDMTTEKDAKRTQGIPVHTKTMHNSPRKRKRTTAPNAPSGPPEGNDTEMTGPNEDAEMSQPGDELRRNLDGLTSGKSQKQQEYEGRRNDLLKEQNTDSWDRKARASASIAENEAADIVWKIREYERETLFGNKASEALPLPDTLDMGGQFLTNRIRIEKSKLFDIALQIPKGAHLHAHFNAELPVKKLLLEARKMDETFFLRSTLPLLSTKDYRETEIVFSVFSSDKSEADPFSPDYNPEWKSGNNNPWIKWKTFRQRFSAEVAELEIEANSDDSDVEAVQGDESTARTELEPAENWVKQKMVLQEDEVYGKDQTVNGIWARFNQATRCFKGFLGSVSLYKWYIKEAVNMMVKDKVMYAELRPMLLDKSIPSDDGRSTVPLDGQMRIITEVVNEVKEELKAKNQLEAFPFGIKIIYCTPRSIPKQKMISELEDCINLKLQFPDLICGFDLVGAEDRPNHIGYYRDELLAFVETCKKLNIQIPFMFHAGETLLDTGGSRLPENSNLYESVLLNSKRIGHGFALTKHPALIEQFKKQNICIELCPISNELLHLCRNVKEHPFPELLAAGIPCTVNADNPTLFRANMSHEFYQVMVGSPTISLHSWRQLAEWSLEYSCLKDDERELGIKIFKEAWEVFCGWIIEKYGKFAETLAFDE